MNLPDLDILSFLSWLRLFSILGGILVLIGGISLIRTSGNQAYFRRRRDQLRRGWRGVVLGIILELFAVLLFVVGEPVATAIYPITATVSPIGTITPTPTISETPTLTLSPTMTLTPAESYTPTITPTPYVPLAVEAQFEGIVTPSADVVFSPLIFAKGYDANYQPIGANTIFRNPVGHLYAVFSYDQMTNGVQWTALWYRAGELVHFETLVWNGGTGGYGFTDWNPDAEMWLPGQYQVQIFVGLQAVQVGEFTIEGDPATSTVTPSNTPDKTDTPTITPTPSEYPTLTITPSRTAWPTYTPTPITPTRTPWPTYTHTPTETVWPTNTPSD